MQLNAFGMIAGLKFEINESQNLAAKYHKDAKSVKAAGDVEKARELLSYEKIHLDKIEKSKLHILKLQSA